RSLAQVKRHENAVRILHIIVEWLAFGETMFPVQGNCRLEIIPRARLKAQSRNSTRACTRDDVLEHGATYPFPSRRERSVHRFHLAMIFGEPLQRSHR